MVKLNAYAKLNLMLAVGDKRADGYHNVTSIMQSISLCDSVTVEKAEETSLACNMPGIPTDGGNLALKAADRFFAHTGIDGRVRISLDKRIPTGAGLGGGSADGAAVLWALDDLYGTRLGVDALCALGAPLGADVPFCIRGGTCLATEKGDVLSPLPHARLHFVLLFGKKELSTPYMYGELHKIQRPAVDAECCVDAWRRGDLSAALKCCGNSFYPISAAEDATVDTNRNALLGAGAVYACISGKGPTVFGVFKSPEEATDAANTLGGIYCHSVDIE